MISPRGRLLIWFSATVLPLALLGPVIPGMAVTSVAGILGVVAIALVDALVSLGRGMEVEIGFPEVVRLSNGREGGIPFSVRSGGRSTGRLRVGLAFPAEILPEKGTLLIDPPPPGEAAHFELRCTPLKRGGYKFGTCYMEWSSVAGLWSVRRKVSISLEVRVYPNMLDEKRSVAGVLLNRGVQGLHYQRQMGQGREFERLREYVHGDSYDSIHWKATARRSRPITKVYQLERSQDVYVIIDSSRLSARPPAPVHEGTQPEAGHESVLERFVTSGLVLCMAAERQGDNFGLITFSEGVGRFLRAGGGRAHFNACKEALYTLKHDSSTSDYNELCTFISMRLRKRAMLIFLTCLDDPVLAEGFTRNMEILRRKHLPVACMIRPAGAVPLFSGDTAGSTSEIYSRLGGHLMWHDMNELGRTLSSRGVVFRMLGSGSMSSELVETYASLKRRQAL